MKELKTFTDQLNRTIEIPFPPERIISLVPSQTELLFDLGLENEVVGITKFCIHPTIWFNSKARVGGTKKVNIERIRELNPDLIIANKEENTKEEIEALSGEFTVWISDIENLDDALKMIHTVGEITNKADRTKEICDEIILNFNLLKTSLISNPLNKVVYLIWKNPIISVGTNTFIHSMLNQNNFSNALVNRLRYPELSETDLVLLKPDVVLLSSEPYPFKENHVDYFQKILPHSKVVLVDGEMFSWYGSRLVKAPKYFINLAKELLQ